MSDSLAYLKQVISDDGEQSSSDILALRGSRRQASTSSGQATSPKANKSSRADVEQALSQVADQLFEGPSRDLSSDLAKIDASNFPDLARRCNRLRSIVVARGQIDGAGSHPKTDAKLYRCLLKVLGQNKADGAQTKNQFLRTLTGAKRRKAVLRTVRLWRDSFPKLYALESAWFQQLQKSKSIHKSRRKPAAIGSFFFIYIVIRIVSTLMRND